MLYNNNSKLGIGVYSFSLPTTTCKHATQRCKSYCYAKKGFLATNMVKKSMTKTLVKTKKPMFVTDMIKEIKKRNCKYIRVHVCGDFYNQEYIDKWMKIASECPNTRFLAYTRNYDAIFHPPSNFTLYFSQDECTVKTNPTINLKAIVKSVDGSHMQKDKDGFICNSKCDLCKACFYGRINIVFPQKYKYS